MSIALAIDIGGTKTDVGLVDSEGVILDRSRMAMPAGGSAEQLFASICELIDAVVDNVVGTGDRPVVCGVGCGGPMTRGGAEVSPINIGAWRSFPLRARLEEHLGLPVVVENDAKALALAEGWRGAAVGVHDYIAMVVSTGVGGGIVLDGRLLDGNGGNAGHIGHLCVEPDGRICGCGARGCLEAEASGTAIAAITGAPAEFAGLEVIERTGRLVGRAVASVANLLDLRLALVAGSVALGFGEPFLRAARAELARGSRLDFSRGVELRPAGLGADGPLIGAGAVAWSGLGRFGA